MSILIVDDSPDVLLMLAFLLKDAGYTDVMTAASVGDAFKCLGITGPAGRISGVDLVLMDLMLPGRNGIEACRRIKQEPHLQDVPVIIMTGHNQPECLEEAFDSGAKDYITKPVSRVELLARVRSALALKDEMDWRKFTNIELERESLAKTQILSTVTHELKSPLASIVGYINAMLQQQDMVGTLNERQREYLEAAQRNSYRLKALIDDLLDVSRIEAGDLGFSLTELEVRQQIEEVVASHRDQAKEKLIQVVVEIPPDLPLVMADQLRFCQIVSNLLSNAFKYSPEGSTVTITAKQDRRLVQIDVSDTGIGISNGDQARLFSKFFRVDNSLTRDASGSGLGLFIIKHIIGAHGGRIWVASEKGKGSTFSFTLHQAEASAPQVLSLNLGGHYG